MKQRGYAEVANTWNVMVENARPVVESLGQAAERHQALATHIRDLISLNERAEASRSEVSLVMKQRRELVAEGRRLYRRLSADLQAHHGLDSSELIRYGLVPQGRPRKKKETATTKAKVEKGDTQVEVAPA